MLFAQTLYVYFYSFYAIKHTNYVLINTKNVTFANNKCFFLFTERLWNQKN